MNADAGRAAEERGPSLLALQVLRFAAAAVIVVHHATYDAATLAVRDGRPVPGLEAVFDWTFGVPVFFVLSGFIMVHAERGFGRAGAGRRFLVRRIIRVVPLYWVLTTVLLAGAVLAPSLLNTPIGGWKPVLGSYLFVAVARTPTEHHPVLGQGWTLNYEMFFYVLFAFAMPLRRGWGLGLLVAALLLLTAAGAVLQPQSPALRTWTGPLLIDFVLGIGVALARQRGMRISALASAALVIIGPGAIALCMRLPDLAGLAASPLLQGAAAASMVAGLAWGPAWPATPLVLVGSLLGDASYSCYLVHPFVIRSLRAIWPGLAGSLPLGCFVAAGLLLSIGVSLLLYLGLERPVTRTLRRWIDVPHGPATPTEAATAVAASR